MTRAPIHLRPTAPLADRVLLPGDPGRALMLAQELLFEPKMSNHARGLWGYTGGAAGGRDLTIQSTGMGGPSAAVVLGDLAELGVRRAVRIGTCTALAGSVRPGALLVVSEARALPPRSGGEGDSARPDPELTEALAGEIGEEGRLASIASLDTLRMDMGAGELPDGTAEAADMQTAALLGAGRELGVALAAVLVVADGTEGESLDDAAMAEAARRAGHAAQTVLLPSG